MTATFPIPWAIPTEQEAAVATRPSPQASYLSAASKLDVPILELSGQGGGAEGSLSGGKGSRSFRNAPGAKRSNRHVARLRRSFVCYRLQADPVASKKTAAINRGHSYGPSRRRSMSNRRGCGIGHAGYSGLTSRRPAAPGSACGGR